MTKWLIVGFIFFAWFLAPPLFRLMSKSNLNSMREVVVDHQSEARR